MLPGFRSAKLIKIFKNKKMTLPKDPYMLLSIINMKLRDGGYESLTDLCKSEGVEESELRERLSAVGFEYNPDIRQFR